MHPQGLLHETIQVVQVGQAEYGEVFITANVVLLEFGSNLFHQGLVVRKMIQSKGQCCCRRVGASYYKQSRISSQEELFDLWI